MDFTIIEKDGVPFTTTVAVAELMGVPHGEVLENAKLMLRREKSKGWKPAGILSEIDDDSGQPHELCLLNKAGLIILGMEYNKPQQQRNKMDLMNVLLVAENAHKKELQRLKSAQA